MVVNVTAGIVQGLAERSRALVGERVGQAEVKEVDVAARGVLPRHQPQEPSLSWAVGGQYGENSWRPSDRHGPSLPAPTAGGAFNPARGTSVVTAGSAR